MATERGAERGAGCSAILNISIINPEESKKEGILMKSADDY